MRLSIVIATRNRAAMLRLTLQRLERDIPRWPGEAEIIVVDDASTDGTPPMVREHFLDVRVIEQCRRTGPAAARNAGIGAARGTYVLLLDDDSYPLGDAAPRMLRYLDERPNVAAVVGHVQRPDGTSEASALPGVFIACATCLRRRALQEVGGFPPEFKRQAEEYDVSFRLWQAGWRIERFEDLHFCHEKSDASRHAARILALDLRNNLILAERYLAPALRCAYRADWLLRYTALATQQGAAQALRRARWSARGWALRERWRGRRLLGAEAIEAIFGLEAQRCAVAEWTRQHHVQRIAIADLGKNIYATWRACAETGRTVHAVIDEHPAFRGWRYRAIPIVPDVAVRDAGIDGIDGIVLSNVNPAQVEPRLRQLRERFPGIPILRLWHPCTLAESTSTTRPDTFDVTAASVDSS